ncbi:MAG: Gfo/Idh/MocA family oxidoreductase [Bryobacteraceae bacterium]|jgi:predicted dehydrogenase
MSDNDQTANRDLTRRDFVIAAGTVTAAGAASAFPVPAIQKVSAASNQVLYGVIGTGAQGSYLLRHMAGLQGCRCAAVCDTDGANLKKGVAAAETNPQAYQDYRELLARKDIDAVVISTPLSTHFPIARDALMAGKHVFCEPPLVFKPEEVHALRALAAERPKQVIQAGFQRRYSKFYQVAKMMVAKGLIGNVTHVAAQWHRNPGWLIPPDPASERYRYWMIFREYSAGLAGELGSHQIDVACWMFNAQPEYVIGIGGQEFVRDGRDIDDNIQLLYRYRRGQKLIYSAISTNQHLPLFGGMRAECGETIMGTGGTIEITLGSDKEPCIALWYYEPRPPLVTRGTNYVEPPVIGGATLGSMGNGRKGFPLLLEKDQFQDGESFLGRELKYARRWLYSQGVTLPEEDRNPVDVQMESFFDCCRTGDSPKADVEAGLASSTAVILSNLAMGEERRVYFNEIEKMGLSAKPGAKD